METKNSGVGFFSLLFLVFLVLKLTEVIDWSWWWVTMPIWGFIALALVLFIAVWVISIGVDIINIIRLQIKLWRIKK